MLCHLHLQMRKSRHREVQELVRGHTAREWQGLDSDLALSPEATLLTALMETIIII